MTLSPVVHRLLAGLLDFVWPDDCLACGSPLDLRQAHGACLGCWGRLRPLRETCRRCGEPTAISDLLAPVGLPCARCLLSGGFPEVEAVRPAVLYDAVARRLLLGAKHGRRPELLPLLGMQLASLLGTEGFADGCKAVVPVPPHPLRRLRRGFDPALEIARPVAAFLGVPLLHPLRRRVRHGGPAKRLSASARRRALADAFRPSGCRPLPSPILLVDDILTTGATARACARALHGLGVEEVRVAVWARTPRRAPI